MAHLISADQLFSPFMVPAVVKGPEQGAVAVTVSVRWRPAPTVSAAEASMGAGAGADLDNRQRVDIRKDEIAVVVVGATLLGSRDGIESVKTWLVDRVDSANAKYHCASVHE